MAHCDMTIDFSFLSDDATRQRIAEKASRDIALAFDRRMMAASTPAEFERELSAEDMVHRGNRAALGRHLDAQLMAAAAIPVGDAQEVDSDAGTKFYGPLGGMKPGRTFRASEGWEAPRVDPMCAAMSQPRFGMFPPGTKASVIRWPDLDDAPAKRCLADDLATRDFFERGPAPAEVPERAPERAKPPLAGFDVVHEGRWHLS
jgi:hypothetical protein